MAEDPAASVRVTPPSVAWNMTADALRHEVYDVAMRVVDAHLRVKGGAGGGASPPTSLHASLKRLVAMLKDILPRFLQTQLKCSIRLTREESSELAEMLRSGAHQMMCQKIVVACLAKFRCYLVMPAQFWILPNYTPMRSNVEGPSDSVLQIEKEPLREVLEAYFASNVARCGAWVAKRTDPRHQWFVQPPYGNRFSEQEKSMMRTAARDARLAGSFAPDGSFQESPVANHHAGRSPETKPLPPPPPRQAKLVVSTTTSKSADHHTIATTVVRGSSGGTSCGGSSSIADAPSKQQREGGGEVDATPTTMHEVMALLRRFAANAPWCVLRMAVPKDMFASTSLSGWLDEGTKAGGWRVVSVPLSLGVFLVTVLKPHGIHRRFLEFCAVNDEASALYRQCSVALGGSHAQSTWVREVMHDSGKGTSGGVAAASASHFECDTTNSLTSALPPGWSQRWLSSAGCIVLCDHVNHRAYIDVGSRGVSRALRPKKGTMDSASDGNTLKRGAPAEVYATVMRGLGRRIEEDVGADGEASPPPGCHHEDGVVVDHIQRRVVPDEDETTQTLGTPRGARSTSGTQYFPSGTAREMYLVPFPQAKVAINREWNRVLDAFEQHGTTLPCERRPLSSIHSGSGVEGVHRALLSHSRSMTWITGTQVSWTLMVLLGRLPSGVMKQTGIFPTKSEPAVGDGTSGFEGSALACSRWRHEVGSMFVVNVCGFVVDSTAVYAVIASMHRTAREPATAMDGDGVCAGEEEEVPPYPLMPVAFQGTMEALQLAYEPEMVAFGHHVADWMTMGVTAKWGASVGQFAERVFGPDHPFVAIPTDCPIRFFGEVQTL